MTRTTRPSSGKTVYHRDGTVTLWDCLTQSWQRGRPSHEVLATFPAAESDRIAKHCGYKIVRIRITIDAFTFCGNNHYTDEDVEKYQNELTYALDDELVGFCYKTDVCITDVCISDGSGEDLRITDISGLDFEDPNDSAIADFIRAALGDNDFTADVRDKLGR